MNPETQALWQEYERLKKSTGKASLGSHLHVPTRKKHGGTDISGLYNPPSKRTTDSSPHSNPQVGDVWTDVRNGKVFTWNGHVWVVNTTDDEDLVEVHECKECSYELKSVEDHEWGLCPRHMPNFDVAFTADEHELYMGKHNGGAMAVGFVRHIKELEMMVENLQEQIIELSKGDK